jgi:GNAT superfamily N-acetyltransferase
MLSSSILSPTDCTPQALADFEKLVIKAGTVDPQGLAQRIRDASRLLFLRESNGQLIGVGGLKHPLFSYRSKVFAKARATASSDEYRIELGWVAVAKSHQGRGLSRRIIGQLIRLVESDNITRRPGQMHEQCTLRLITGLSQPVSLIRAAAVMILFCIFALRRPSYLKSR